jgi:hypothetical protein
VREGVSNEGGRNEGRREVMDGQGNEELTKLSRHSWRTMIPLDFYDIDGRI